MSRDAMEWLASINPVAPDEVSAPDEGSADELLASILATPARDRRRGRAGRCGRGRGRRTVVARGLRLTTDADEQKDEGEYRRHKIFGLRFAHVGVHL